MKIGIPKEIKNGENRVALPASGVLDLIRNGHEVFVETNAGLGASIRDEEYQAVGARIVSSAKEAWAQELVLKVKEPLKEEYEYLREDLTLFTYLHLAANKPLAEELMKRKTKTLAYESVQLSNGELPLLAPMSEIAGRLAAQIGAQFLEKVPTGKGILLGGVPGVKKGKVTIIGGGISGCNAAKIALGLGADVTILDVNIKKLQEIDNQFNGAIKTLVSNHFNIQEAVKEADLVIGAVLIPGRKAPVLVTEEMVVSMPEHSVIIDIAIDQGGIFETIDEVTTHQYPTYVKHDVIHYAVANMPGAVPQTATFALANATLQYIVELANHGFEQAAEQNPALRSGINTLNGALTNQAVAIDLDLPYSSIQTVL
ncbi:alanine dehydrogenase [Enterococcus ureilyticus]|uniref:Alanine dehydrogenase n=1 Tax=Enterococcus ureilyticus TaxID=1131292 RepID=A0A1E5HF52_9ENTE|nr:alanine dehydrogenase [Enterococcus ureilyticus]MBM7687436.1 alanine dehydrogenase [Enterococcus ureilyticus]MBO0445089.1 alanine dehydrogenase [Enterococcus ureilyticus]OEG23486.1 alanine dehydrogenase [Enterococcus ureilyticus]